MWTQLTAQAVAVSELPGYPGRQHTQQCRCVTAEFPHEVISTIDNFTWAIPGRTRVWNRQWVQVCLSTAPTLPSFTDHFIFSKNVLQSLTGVMQVSFHFTVWLAVMLMHCSLKELTSILLPLLSAPLSSSIGVMSSVGQTNIAVLLTTKVMML